MTQALIKKQLLEVFAWVFQDKKTGKNRKGSSLVANSLLYISILGLIIGIFYYMADSLCAPLISFDMGWLYYAIMGLLGIVLGVFASVFNTYTTLYQAKDNDLLLSMPVPASKILFARLLGIYTMGLLYELLVMLPATVVFYANINIGLLGVVFTILMPFLLGFVILALSCIVGYAVALIASHLKSKKLVTVFLSLLFIAAYYYFYAHAYSILQGILLNPVSFGEKVSGIAYPLYQMGLAAEGRLLPMLIFTCMSLVFFALIYFILAKSFVKLATTNKSSSKTKYVKREAKVSSQSTALLSKEFRRFLGSTNYILNCGLGIVLIIIASAFVIVKGDFITGFSSSVPDEYMDAFYLMAAAAVCLSTTMNDMTAPSISLEGKNLWILQSLPVSSWQIIKAKLHMHLILTLVPLAILIVCVEVVVKPSALFAILIPVIAVLFVLLTASAGLISNLLMPNLTWTNEVVPIKQSASVFLALFGSWALITVLGGVYYLMFEHISAGTYAVIVAIIFTLCDVLMLRWLKFRGTKLFDEL